MNRHIISESHVHYVTGFLERYADKYPNRKHADALKEFRDLSNMLLENLGQPAALNIIRHNLKK